MEKKNINNAVSGDFVVVTETLTNKKKVGFVLKKRSNTILVYFPEKLSDAYYLKYIPFNCFYKIEVASHLQIDLKFRKKDISYMLRKEHMGKLSKINLIINRAKL